MEKPTSPIFPNGEWDYFVEYDNKKRFYVKDNSITACPLKVVFKNEVISVIGHAETDKNRLYVLTKDGHKGFDGGCHRANRYKLPPSLPPTKYFELEKARINEK